MLTGEHLLFCRIKKIEQKFVLHGRDIHWSNIVPHFIGYGAKRNQAVHGEVVLCMEKNTTANTIEWAGKSFRLFYNGKGYKVKNGLAISS